MMYVVGIILFLILLVILVIYNKIVKSKLKVDRSKSTIDVYLTQRFDLIPNLVQCVKSYQLYESELLNKIVEMRTTYMDNKKIENAEELDNVFRSIMISLENYPKIKSDEQFLELQKSLSKMENQLQAARRIYNMDVNTYNTVISTIPNNIIAKLFKFNLISYFEAEEDVKKNINIGEINK